MSCQKSVWLFLSSLSRLQGPLLLSANTIETAVPTLLSIGDRCPRNRDLIRGTIFEAVANVDRQLARSHHCAGESGRRCLQSVLSLYDAVSAREKWDLSSSQREAVRDFALYAREVHGCIDHEKNAEACSSESDNEETLALSLTLTPTLTLKLIPTLYILEGKESKRVDKEAQAREVLSRRTGKVVVVLENVADLR